MSRLEHAGDFVFGVALLAATPILVFVGTVFVAAKIPLFEGYRVADYVGRWAILGISFTGFLLACMWRKKHRRIPSSVLELVQPQLSIRVSQVEICWDASTNTTYQLQLRSALSSGVWNDLGATIAGTGQANCVMEKVFPSDPQRFYRMITKP